MFLGIFSCYQKAKIQVKVTLSPEINVPYMRNGRRDYRREYDLYHSKPEQIKNRTMRTQARREAIDDGLVKKGEKKDIDHRTPLSQGGSNAKSNRRVVDASANRSFSRNADGSLKSQTSKREATRRRK